MTNIKKITPALAQAISQYEGPFEIFISCFDGSKTEFCTNKDTIFQLTESAGISVIDLSRRVRDRRWRER